jgi:DNA adenine methylase
MAKKKIINVASVPQRSPFRYPGGKTWLVPYVRTWLRSLPVRPSLFCEPFAGGGIVGLTVAFEMLADRVLLIELDSDVAAVWKAILGGDAQWLADRIMEFTVSVEAVKAEIAKTPLTLREKAFRTILRNRVLHGGILAPGSSFTKYGENGKGIASRWYPTTLRRRILAIADVRERIEFIEGDGLSVLRQRQRDINSVFFIDPPYTAAGKRAGIRLYQHNELDHDLLFRITADLAGDFLMTYDNAKGVIAMAKEHGFDTELVPMKSTHHAEMMELLIGRHLSWARLAGKRDEQGQLPFPDEA